MAGKFVKPRQRARWQTVALVALLASGAFIHGTSPAIAQQFNTNVGASERISYAAELGAVSQHAIAAACNLNAGIEAELSKENLEHSILYFESIMNALTMGDESLGVIGEERRARTLNALNAVNVVWTALRDEAASTVEGAGDQVQIASLATKGDAILDATTVLQSEIFGQYADPVSLSQADAVLIEIAGRQRLFAEMMSKDMCLVASGVNTEAAASALSDTINIFDLSLKGLQDGVPQMGISGPPTEVIAAGLTTAATQWDGLMPVLKSIAAGDAIDAGASGAAYSDLLSLEKQLEEIVHQYSENSKLNL